MLGNRGPTTATPMPNQMPMAPMMPGYQNNAPAANPSAPISGMASGGTAPQSASASVTTNGGSPLQQVLSQNMRHTGQPGTHPYAGGGAPSRHVQGPGDGTSDSIPARLANGEYVIDAQTVSMLGNGDNGSGAKVLDAMRHNIRKHKGQALAKGQMAPDAKPIEHYMGGK